MDLSSFGADFSSHHLFALRAVLAVDEPLPLAFRAQPLLTLAANHHPGRLKRADIIRYPAC